MHDRQKPQRSSVNQVVNVINLLHVNIALQHQYGISISEAQRARSKQKQLYSQANLIANMTEVIIAGCQKSFSKNDHCVPVSSAEISFSH